MQTAPAKIILFGEHAVVYGQPAIAVPFNTLTAMADVMPAPAGTGLMIIAKDTGAALPVTADTPVSDNSLVLAAQLTLKKLNVPPPDLTLEIRSTIPVASGLGSGAAVSTALIRELSAAVGQLLADDDLNELVYEVEKLHHGTPSGIDNTVIVRNAPIFFIRGETPAPVVIGRELTFLVADSGISASTRASVGAVRELVEHEPQVYQAYVDQIGQIVREARAHLEKGYLLGIGHLMNLNHNALRSLTVSSPELDKLTGAAREAGAFGAKLSGGGRGGNLIALIDLVDAEKITQALYKAGAAHVWTMTLNATGKSNPIPVDQPSSTN